MRRISVGRQTNNESHSMRAGGVFFTVFTLAGLTIGLASPPTVSPRPKPRIVHDLTADRSAPVAVSFKSDFRPKPRDSSLFSTVVAIKDVVRASGSEGDYVLASTPPVYQSPRPENRPRGLNTSVRPVATTPRTNDRVARTNPVVISREGSLCGDPRIKGERLAAIPGKLPGCGLAHPVKVSSIDGVVLSQGSIMDCTTARSLSTWVRHALKPTIRSRGGGVKSLTVPSHYSCRTRNSQPGAKISEHGKGHAIDISAINLKDGSKITVLQGWNNRRDKRILQKLHSAACGPFGTVLGPNSDRFHRDHFHFDTARHRGGPYCR